MSIALIEYLLKMVKELMDLNEGTNGERSPKLPETTVVAHLKGELFDS